MRGRPGWYWLVASGTPLGWCGGCLAAGLVRGSVRHYCLGGCSALFVCARRSRQVWEARAGAGFCVFPIPPLPPSVPRAACGGLSCPDVTYRRPLVRQSMRSVRSAGLVWFPFWYSTHVLCVCVHSRSCGVRPFLPPRVGVARAPRVAPVQGASRAVPCGLCPSEVPASVLCAVWLAWGGGSPSCSPHAWLAVVCPLSGGSVRPGREGSWGGGGAECHPPRGLGPGAPRGGGSL